MKTNLHSELVSEEIHVGFADVMLEPQHAAERLVAAETCALSGAFDLSLGAGTIIGIDRSAAVMDT